VGAAGDTNPLEPEAEDTEAAQRVPSGEEVSRPAPSESETQEEQAEPELSAAEDSGEAQAADTAKEEDPQASEGGG